MNNREVVAMLEECRQTAAAGSVEPTDEAKEGFLRCRASLSAELSALLQDAAAMKWPFVPEKWQYKQAVTLEDKTTLKELISRHLPQLLMLLRASLLAGEPLWAASTVFLVDRFLYWVDTSKSLLKIAQALHKHYPTTPIAPQVVIRQARLSLNSGKLQKAEYILSSLINNSGATGCWVYHADSDRVLVQAVSVQVRGQVLQKLGMWIEAAELIWASLIGLHALPEPDRKGIGTSLGLLANILVSMNDTDFQAFIAGQHMDLRLLKERGHRLLAAAEAAKMAVVYSQYDSLYVLSNVVTQGICLLAYSFSPGCGPTEREAILGEAKEAFQIGLLAKREGEVVTSKQDLHLLIKAAYSLTVTHKWLGSARGQVIEASQVCQEVVEKLHAYSAVGGGERDALGAEIMGLVGRVKVVLGVKPFTTSDERSFIPDSYRSAEETPVRFSTDHFSEVMGRFRKHHASVCQAHRMSRSGASRSGVQECSVTCITTMKTATETLDTEGATEKYTHDNWPLGRRPDRQTKGGHVEQQCSNELTEGEETDGATSSEGCGFKGMSKKTSTSCSFRDRPASLIDAGVRSKGRNAVTCAIRKAETRVDQKCLTEVSDEDGENVSSEDPGSLAGYEGESASGYRQSPHASSRGTSALPSSWESISYPDTESKKGPNDTTARVSANDSVTEWVEVGMELQYETKDSNKENMKAGQGSKGCQFNGVDNGRNSSSSLKDPSPFIEPKKIGKDKKSVTRAKQRVAMWVDQQCPTEFSDEEVNSETNSKRLGIKGMDKARTSSCSPRDGPPSVIKPKSLNKWVDPQCPTEFSDEEVNSETNSKGLGIKGMDKARTSSCSPRDGPPSVIKPKSLNKWVDPQCPTEFSDEEVNSETNSKRLGIKGMDKARTSSCSPRDGPPSVIKPKSLNKWVDPQCPTEFSDEEVNSETNSKGLGIKGMDKARTSSCSPRDGPPSVIKPKSLSKWVDPQCPTEFSDEEVNSETNSKGLGIKGMDKARTSSCSPRDGPPSVIKPKSLSKWVDPQCATEFSDEEVDGETSLAGHGFKGMGSTRTASSPLGDSLGSNSSWQKLCLSDTGSPVTSGKDSRRPSDNHTEEEWVNVDCPKAVKDEVLDKAGSSFKDTRRVGSLCDSLSSGSSWQKLSFSDAGSALSSGRGACSSAKQRVRVDRQCPTEGSDMEDQRDTGSFPARALKADYHQPEPRQVDPKAETEDYVLGDLSMSAECDEPKDSAAEIGGVGHFAEPKSFRIMGNEEGREGELGKLYLDDYQQPSYNNQSHNRCLGKCTLCSLVPECSPTLTEQDYKALLSGVCHKCLLNRLDVKKTFRLRKHRTAYSALLLKYSKVTDRWTSRETKVFIGDPIGKKGCQRTAFWVQILHQEEVLGSYVGKTYQFEKEIRYHLTDVERQMTAQYYVTEFNKRLYEKSVPAQLFFIPSEVLLILEGDVITDCVTVEPYMLGDFVKLTNNTVYTNQNYEATDYGIAFGHFTYQLSGGKEVVVDLQGWVTDNGKGLTYLTDPQIHSVTGVGSRHGARGIKQFLENQHGPQCNGICKALSLGLLQ
ncbi:alpha-protein kinase 1 [Conger conger]|uniref:alpha-protein kinase 1 n=1 Tax=Conger conger TaxID=82655 RepID=UPI002A5A4E98|nr:alpha-protein kinase 1 [Conger conger]